MPSLDRGTEVLRHPKPEFVALLLKLFRIESGTFPLPIFVPSAGGLNYESHTAVDSRHGDRRGILLLHNLAVEFAGRIASGELAEPSDPGGDHRSGAGRVARRRRAEQYFRLQKEYSVRGKRDFPGDAVRLFLRDGAAGGSGIGLR